MMRNRFFKLSLTLTLVAAQFVHGVYPLVWANPASSTVEPSQGFNPGTSHLVMTNEQFQTWITTKFQALSNAKNGQSIQLISLSPKDQESLTLSAHIGYVNYKLAPGDVIKITVDGREELSQDYAVNLSGVTTFSLIGNITLSGKTLHEIETELTNRYKEYLVDPKILVGIKKTRPHTTYVLGAVKSPGPYTQSSRTATIGGIENFLNVELSNPYEYRLSTALANSGGLLEDSDITHIKIYNESLGYLKEANMLDMIVSGDMTQDITLQPFDIIYVPKLPNAQQLDSETLQLLAESNIGKGEYPIAVTGLVGRSEVFYLKPDQMNLQFVLTKASPRQEADKKHIIIARAKTDGNLEQIVVDGENKDVMLRPNDIVMLTNRTTRSHIQRGVGMFGALLMPFIGSTMLLRNIDSLWPIVKRNN